MCFQRDITCIMMGKAYLGFNTLKTNFGSYVLVYLTNTTRSRSTGAVVLNPMGNIGKHHFMCLTMGQRLAYHHQWMVLPRPNATIAAVEASAERQRQVEGRCSKFQLPNMPMTMLFHPIKNLAMFKCTNVVGIIDNVSED